MYRSIRIGQSDFRTIRYEGHYYVDKTSLVTEVLESPHLVLLLPRPRRFGKTLNQTMLHAFFDDREDSRAIFEGLAVATHSASMGHLNAYPTLFLSLKDMSHNSWDECQQTLKLVVARLIRKHRLRVWDKADTAERLTLQKLVEQKASLAEYQDALRMLSELLERTSGRKTIILIDEYDNPIHRANTNGYLDQILNFLRNFFGAALKDNPSLARAVITGVLRIGRESIYSDLNNLGVYSVLETPFSTAFGFTEKEVKQVLTDCDLLGREDEIKAWYNGYQFGKTTIYNPWSILSLASSTDGHPQAFWINTSSNDLSRELIMAGRGYHLKDLETLLAGGTILRPLDVSVALRDLNPESIWNLLLFSGYLTPRGYDARSKSCALAIPNNEVRQFFESVVMNWLGPPEQANQLIDHLLAWRMNEFGAVLKEVVATIVSFHDTAGKQPEQIYHIFFIGLLVQLSNRYELISNIESGHGRADLILIPRIASEPGFIFEFKSHTSPKDLNKIAQQALKQIFDKDYSARLRARNVSHWIAIGLACFSKHLDLVWREGNGKTITEYNNPTKHQWHDLQGNKTTNHEINSLEPAISTPKAQESDSFRVLLLATDNDLGKVRNRVATYLRQAMGMLVDENTEFNGQQAVVLLQALRWHNGTLARAWQAAPQEQRLLFLSTNASWPPFSLVEVAALTEIETFRKQYTPTAMFDSPDQLQVPVVDALMTLRQATSPTPILRPTASERAYLRRWKVFWSRGRTRGKKSETDEIFERELYVPLSGVSVHFYQDNFGRILPRDPKPSAPSTMGLRLPLTRWAAAKELRLQVLCGSPGTGKTVFLTRLAAMLAGHLLGEEVEQYDALKWEEAHRPIPFVVEAIKLAQQPLNVANLAALINQELATVQAPDASLSKIEQQLQDGRFILLIDALDEVTETRRRRDLNNEINKLAEALPTTRMIVTTRPTRYTGDLALNPAFSIITIDRLDNEQVDLLCSKFLRLHPDAELKTGDLREAVAKLDGYLQAQGQEAFSTNALMLTCICIVYKRYHNLPDERVQLLDKLVEELCNARPAGLNPKQKRDLLERLAHAMQEKGTQQIPHAVAEQVIAESPWALTDHSRLLRTMTWLLETGLIYEEASEQGNFIRFAHRLLREYLCACRLVGDSSMDELVSERIVELADPAWLDVFALLPGVRYRADLAYAFTTALRRHAESSRDGRLWGVLAAGMVENHSLYAETVRQELAEAITQQYETGGASWALETRVFVLEQLGRLGDPRLDPLKASSWIYLPAAEYPFITEMSGKAESQVYMVKEGIFFGRFPVTNAEYLRFISAGGYLEPRYWDPEGWMWLNMDDHSYEDWLASRNTAAYGRSEWHNNSHPMRNPKYWNDVTFNKSNQPVVGVSWFEAIAYCRWLTEQLNTAGTGWWGEAKVQVRLPMEVEWMAAACGGESRRYPWGNMAPNGELANFDGMLGATSPVGCFPLGRADQLWDMAGNVWEWCLDSLHTDASEEQETLPGEEPSEEAFRALHGGAWSASPLSLQNAYHSKARVDSRTEDIGFRVCFLLKSFE